MGHGGNTGGDTVRGVFEGQAGALRKPEQGDAARGNLGLLQPREQPANQGERRGQIWLVALNRFDEAVWIPGLTDGVWREDHHSRRSYLTRQVDDVRRICAPTVKRNDGAVGFIQGSTRRVELGLAVRI